MGYYSWVGVKFYCSNHAEGILNKEKYNRGRGILMSFRLPAVLFLAPLLFIAAPKKTVVTARGENQDIILTVTVYTTPEDVKELLGSDLEGHYMAADIKVEPKYGKDIVVSHDDFVLRDMENVEKSTPFEPSQIAGKAALIIVRNDDGSGNKPARPTFGGGIGGMGGGSGSGSGSNGPTNVKAKMQNADQPKDTALEKLLTDKMLPEKKTDQPATGLLYFALEKVKVKNLQLDYGGKENRISLRFKEKEK